MRVRFTANALQQVISITADVARDNPLAADRIFGAVERAVVRLGDFPNAGHARDKGRIGVVSVPRSSYPIFYTVRSGAVTVVQSATPRAVL